MQSLLIGYDLNKPDQDYTDLIDAIEKQFPNSWHCLDSTWIVKTKLTSKQVRDLLQVHIVGKDALLVVCLTGDWASKGFNRACSTWLRANL